MILFLIWTICCLTSSVASSDHTCDSSAGKCSSEDTQDDASKYKRQKVILFWTTFYGAKYFEFGEGSKPFEQCAVSNCETTADKRRSQEADVVVFHMRNVGGGYPAGRQPHQLYVFFLLEHPYNQWNDLRLFSGFFNVTMTYRTDSDVTLPYGRIVPLPAPCPPDPMESKTRAVAWFVSNCASHSGRENYVRQLQRHIQVDVYGNCGTLQCPSGVPWHVGRMQASCYKMAEARYYFYLSFENIYCKDYVTEKVFNPLKYNIVPIVMGAVNYSQVTPPNSVINVDDFQSPEHLANYLKLLMADKEQYLSYFRWKSKYSVISLSETIPQGFCDLCALANKKNGHQRVYDDLENWWGKKRDCMLKHHKHYP